jgi:hypothetical protein
VSEIEKPEPLPPREPRQNVLLGACFAIADGVLHLMEASGQFAPAEDAPACASHV